VDVGGTSIVNRDEPAEVPPVVPNPLADDVDESSAAEAVSETRDGSLTPSRLESLDIFDDPPVL
jgi:hypothetical protein